MTKKLPYEKTVVIEVKVQLADLFSRTVALKSSTAAPIPVQDQFNTGDAVITHAKPLNLGHVANCVILSSFEDFNVVLGPPEARVTLVCRGLFIHNGAAETVLVTPIEGAIEARMQYIWS